MVHYIQILCLSTLNLINHKKVLSHIKVSKYCHIDVRLGRCVLIFRCKFSYTLHFSSPLFNIFRNEINHLICGSEKKALWTFTCLDNYAYKKCIHNIMLITIHQWVCQCHACEHVQHVFYYIINITTDSHEQSNQL